MYLGSRDIDELLTFPANTHRADTGAATDADAVPSYRVYEDETATPILTGNMALLDAANTAGLYSEQITLSAANGLEKGKSYTIYISATVNSVVGTVSHTFQIQAPVDVVLVGGDAQSLADLKDFADTGYDPVAHAVETVKVAIASTDVTNGVTLANDAITAAKFDESSAFPLAAADAGVTQVARVGADGDTLETLSDEIASVQTDTTAIDTLSKAAGPGDLAAILVDTGTTLNGELAKVPKSDSNVSWNSTALGAVNAEVDTALNTAIPGGPAADSINQRVRSMDILTEASGAGDLAAILVDTGTTLNGELAKVPKSDSNVSFNATALADIADNVWDEVLTGVTHNVTASAGRRLRELAGNIIYTGTAQGAGTGSNQIQLDVGASAVDGAYDPSMLCIVAGVGAGQCRLILHYDGASTTATVDRDWKVNPNAASEFIIYGHPGREHVNEGLAQAGANNTITLNTSASANDDEYIGQIVFIRSGTGQDQARICIAYNGTTKIATVDKNWNANPNSSSAYVMLPGGLSSISTVDGTAVTSPSDFKADVSALALEATLDVVDGIVDTILIDTNEIQGKLPTNEIMGSSDKADHDSDLAGTVMAAAQTELASIPTGISSMQNQIQLTFEILRNAASTTSGVFTLFKEDGVSVLGTAAIADDLTTSTRGVL